MVLPLLPFLVLPRLCGPVPQTAPVPDSCTATASPRPIIHSTALQQRECVRQARHPCM